jgi:hypothetical protein
MTSVGAAGCEATELPLLREPLISLLARRDTRRRADAGAHTA